MGDNIVCTVVIIVEAIA